MKRIVRLISYICLHIMLAILFIDSNQNDKMYSFILGLIFGLICYFLKPSIDVTRKRMMDRTYYYLLFAFFLSFTSFIYKVKVTYEWFDGYGFKIWLNVISIILILKTMYGFICKSTDQKRNPTSDVKAKSLLRKKV